jgi:hypothetical protein
MAITPAERDVLLKRLELARIAKIKKQEEAKAAKAVKAAPEPVVAPPAPAPEPVPQEIQSPVIEPMVAPPVPDLVAASRKKPAKKVCLPISDDEDEEEEAVLPKKKSKPFAKKEQPYMKLKIYREPTNPQAFQSLLESINNPPEYEDEPEPPAPVPFARPPRVVHSNSKAQSVRPMAGADRKFEDTRNMAMAFFS